MATGLSTLRVITRRMFSSRYLFVTNIASFGVLMGAGDIAVQQMSRFQKSTDDKVFKHDWSRTGRMVAIGLVMGPVNHAWYTYLDKILPSVRMAVVGRKILLDQVIASPIMAFLFLVGISLLEKQSLQKSVLEFRGKFWEVYKADWMVWPAAQAVNFLFVPSQFRVVYVGTVTLFWDSFLSYIKHRQAMVLLRETELLAKRKSS